MKRILLLSTVFLYLTIGFVTAQTQDRPLPCISPVWEESEEQSKAYAGIIYSDEEPLNYTIPVVVHVFGNGLDDRKNVSYEIVKGALKDVSKDFQGLQSDWADDNIDNGFESVKTALNINFELAKIDPEGNSTTGVIFHSENEKGFGNGNGYDSKIQKYAWDNYKYMNLYIMHDLYNSGTLNNSGVAWYPSSTMSNSDLSRVVYNGNYLGSNTDSEFRSVLTHEFGHWLNLIHTFEGGCSDSGSNDQVGDTPAVDNDNTKTGPTKNCKDEYINWQNFMDYTNSHVMFTTGQVSRMVQALKHSTRKPLWQDSNLILTGLLADGPNLVLADDNHFIERKENDGVLVDESRLILATGGALFSMDKVSFQEGIHYKVEGLPEGLKLDINQVDDKKIELSIEGKALKHEKMYSIQDVQLTFLDEAVVGDTSALVSSSIKFGIEFQDAYTEYCQPSARYNSDYGHIKLVTISDAEGNELLSNQSTYNLYTDFSSDNKRIEVEQNKIYSVKVDATTLGSGTADVKMLRVWFDYNHDFFFSESERQDYEFQVKDAGVDGDFSHTFNFLVPENAKLSETRIRISLHHKQGTEGEDACGEYDSGETEDYGMTIYDPKAELTARIESILPDQVQLGSQVQFTAKDYPVGTKFEWFTLYDSGKKSIGNGTSLNYIFDKAGINTFMLTSSLGDQILSLTGTVVVENDFDITLTANNSKDYLLGEKVVLTASEFPEGITSFDWEVLKDGEPLAIEKTSNDHPIFDYTFMNSGDITVRVTATVDKKSKSLEKVFTVKNDFNLEYEVTREETLFIGSIVKLQLTRFPEAATVAWKVKINDGDEKLIENEKNSLDYEFSTPGDYTISGEVTYLNLSKKIEENFHVTNVLSNENNKKELLKIYPNPADNLLTVETNGKAEVKIYNSQAKLILQREVANKAIIDVSSFEKGLYYIKSTNQTASQIVKFIIK